LDAALVDYEALVLKGNPSKAVRRVDALAAPESALFRGWMLTPQQYKQLYAALGTRGLQLINTPSAYRHCHYLPECYPVIESFTPRSVWLTIDRELSIDRVMALLRPFGTAPVIVKDFVKSQKHYWEEACYISSAADREAVERVARRFLELQGDDLNEGLVFREFVPFEPLAAHPRSGMPLSTEFRIFFLDGEPIYTTEYWEEGDYAGLRPPVDQFRQVAGEVRSRFFTMDIARRRDGEWMIVELGDGQVAGLPENADAVVFYQALVSHWPASGRS
jgi:hypothetical protein